MTTTDRKPDAVELALDLTMAVRRLLLARQGPDTDTHTIVPKKAIDDVADLAHALADYIAHLGEPEPEPARHPQIEWTDPETGQHHFR